MPRVMFLAGSLQLLIDCTYEGDPECNYVDRLKFNHILIKIQFEINHSIYGEDNLIQYYAMDLPYMGRKLHNLFMEWIYHIWAELFIIYYRMCQPYMSRPCHNFI